MKVLIYTLTDPSSNLVRYIGMTKRSLKVRYYDHVSNYNLKPTTYKNSWIKSLKKKGLRPIITLLDTVDLSIANDMEIYWISQFKAWGFKLVNGTEGGGGLLGVKRKSKFKHSQETKDRIAKSNKRPHSEEWVEAQRRSHYIPIVQLLNNIVIREWDSATEAAIYLGNINKKKNIVTVLKNKRKRAYGYEWRYKV